jgi:membrane associated rhomboid family serine protease
VLVVAAIVATLGYQAGIWPLEPLIVQGAVESEWWRLLTSSFVYATSGYEAVGLTTIALFGWLLERRHGAWATLVVYVLGAVAGAALVVLLDPGDGVSLGGYAPGMALLCAWAVRDLITRRRGGEVGADMLGLGVWFAVFALLPLASVEANALAGVGGAAVGVLLGLSLARMPER